MVCRIGNVLRKDKDVKKGDLVVIYMPVCPLAIASMLACARIGAVHRYTNTGNFGNLAKALDRPICLALLNLCGDWQHSEDNIMFHLTILVGVWYTCAACFLKKSGSRNSHCNNRMQLKLILGVALSARELNRDSTENFSRK